MTIYRVTDPVGVYVPQEVEAGSESHARRIAAELMTDASEADVDAQVWRELLSTLEVQLWT